MTDFMNPAEFANIRKSEETFWWYRGMREILFRMMDPHLKGRHIERALEAGCGTGYLSHLLQRERGLPVVPMDLSGHGLRYRRLGRVRYGRNSCDLSGFRNCRIRNRRGTESLRQRAR